MISSASNNKLKRLVNLNKKKKLREEEGIFIVEGIRMFREVPLDKLREVYVSETFFTKNQSVIEETLSSGEGVSVEIVSDELFSRISDTKTPQGVLCVVERMCYSMEEILGGSGAKEQRAPLVMILDTLQDPGNLGTIVRTGEGAGVTGVIMSPGCVDIYNPKTIRSTMGSIYRVPFYVAEDEEEFKKLIRFLQGENVSTYAAHLEGAVDYDTVDYGKPSAFMIGNEGNGLRDEIAQMADAYIKIPMRGEVESLNAAIAASVLMFEAARRRR